MMYKSDPDAWFCGPVSHMLKRVSVPLNYKVAKISFKTVFQNNRKILLLHENEANIHYGVKYAPTCFYNLPLKIYTFKK